MLKTKNCFFFISFAINTDQNIDIITAKLVLSINKFYVNLLFVWNIFFYKAGCWITKKNIWLSLVRKYIIQIPSPQVGVMLVWADPPGCMGARLPLMCMGRGGFPIMVEVLVAIKCALGRIKKYKNQRWQILLMHRFWNISFVCRVYIF